MLKLLRSSEVKPYIKAIDIDILDHYIGTVFYQQIYGYMQTGFLELEAKRQEVKYTGKLGHNEALVRTKEENDMVVCAIRLVTDTSESLLAGKRLRDGFKKAYGKDYPYVTFDNNKVGLVSKEKWRSMYDSKMSNTSIYTS